MRMGPGVHRAPKQSMRRSWSVLGVVTILGMIGGTSYYVSARSAEKGLPVEESKSPISTGVFPSPLDEYVSPSAIGSGLDPIGAMEEYERATASPSVLLPFPKSVTIVPGPVVPTLPPTTQAKVPTADPVIVTSPSKSPCPKKTKKKKKRKVKHEQR